MKERLYWNGDIITLENELYCDAVLVSNGKIKKVGNKEELLKCTSNDVEIVDLQGKTMMPAFIDAHSHFCQDASFLLDIINESPANEIENKLISSLSNTQDKYFSYGITTAQEGYIVEELTDILLLLKKENLLKIDLIGYIDVNKSEKILSQLEESVGKYDKHIKIGGYKMFLDGYPQEKTAWMKSAYKGKDNYRGYPKYESERVNKFILKALNENIQIIAHCNGDAAIEQYIREYYKALKENNDNVSIRPIIMHAQLLSRGQLDSVKRLKMIPSFLIAHVYYYGDTYINDFGFDKASEISLAQSAVERGIVFTFHQDSPAIEPNMLETIWCAVNRVTKKGILLGKYERVEPLDAIKAVTINAAYQYFEEDIKGTIKEGKKADLIILDKNPLKINNMEIKDIKILETIKNGVGVYKLDN